MTQLVKELATKPDDLSWTTGASTIDGKNQLPHLSSDLQLWWHAHTVHRHIQYININANIKITTKEDTWHRPLPPHMSIKIHEPSTHQADMFSMEDALCASPQHYTRTQKDMAKVCSPCYTESRDRKITWTQVFKTSLEKKHTEYPIKTIREMAQMWLDSYINWMAMQNEGERNIW